MSETEQFRLNSGSVSVIILTLNEAANIEFCLKSVCNWSDDIHVIDSFSQDNTVTIASRFAVNIQTANVAHWADIRNWAMRNLNLKYPWVLFLDADERLTEELRVEITNVLKSKPEENGFYIKRRFIFLGRWLKYGGMYSGILRLFRHSVAKYTADGDVEYVTVKGKTNTLQNDIIHEDRKGVEKWIEKHNRISERASKQFLSKSAASLSKKKKGEEIEGGNRTWVKYNFWERIPLFFRPFIAFSYQYILRLGFLDGVEGLSYHLLQAYWYRLIIYIKVREIQTK